MDEVALARLWHLADGTSCLLIKDPRAENWRLRVVRGSDIVRTEQFGNPIVAMDVAKEWRSTFDRSLEPSR
jgi:hypothetical protein